MPMTMTEAVRDFLAQKRIAVAGVSRSGQGAANLIYGRLRDTGHQVFALNPNAQEIGGEPCYADLRLIPGGVDAVVIATSPQVTDQLVRECADLGIKRIWMHRSFGEGSVSSAAVDYAREQGIAVIAGGCPMMYCEPVDFAHKCMRWVLGISGGLPK